MLGVLIFSPAQLSGNFMGQNTISMVLKKCSVSSVINNFLKKLCQAINSGANRPREYIFM